jgi:hypothetical protein
LTNVWFQPGEAIEEDALLRGSGGIARIADLVAIAIVLCGIGLGRADVAAVEEAVEIFVGVSAGHAWVACVVDAVEVVVVEALGTVDAGVAYVAEAVVIFVGLACVGRGSAVVVGIGDGVAVAVEAWFGCRRNQVEGLVARG